MARNEDCSSKSLKSAAQQQATKEDPNTSIILLNYRAGCYLSQQNYDQAIKEYLSLVAFYQLKNDPPMVEMLQSKIEELKIQSADNKTGSHKAQPDADPELEKSIMQL